MQGILDTLAVDDGILVQATRAILDALFRLVLSSQAMHDILRTLSGLALLLHAMHGILDTHNVLEAPQSMQGNNNNIYYSHIGSPVGHILVYAVVRWSSARRGIHNTYSYYSHMGSPVGHMMAATGLAFDNTDTDRSRHIRQWRIANRAIHSRHNVHNDHSRTGDPVGHMVVAASKPLHTGRIRRIGW